MILNKKDIIFDPTSIIDPGGKVFYYKNKTFRAVFDKDYADTYVELFSSNWINNIFEKGLMPKTKICNDFCIEDCKLILEHETLPFILKPQEFTDKMFYDAVVNMIKINIMLSKKGYCLKDAHSFNFTIFKGKPIFFDFGSITKSNSIKSYWLDEFIDFCAVPVFLANKKRLKKFSVQYRKESNIEFGRTLFRSNKLKKILFNSLLKLNKYIDEPELLFQKILNWLEKNKPASAKIEYWSHYKQGEDFTKPESIKQKFVFEMLKNEKPATVADLAANKGFFSEMATSFGASVIATDYEEELVNIIYKLSKDKNITPAFLDFKYPTPPMDLGIVVASSYERFASDIVFALAIIHHLCLRQGMPVYLFCQICMQYATKGVIVEFIDIEDKHVANWNVSAPENYSLKGIEHFISKKFPKLKKSDPIISDGLNRQILFFHK